MSKKKQALTQFHQNNILSSAEELFINKGILQTTMDDIAKHADYSKATLYAYFKSKDDIYNHIIFNNMSSLKEKIEKNILANSELFKCFMDICNEIAKYAQENPLFLSSILGTIGVSEKEFVKMPVLKQIYEVGEEINALIQKFIDKGIEEGILREDITPMESAISLWSSICGVILVGINKKEYLSQRCNVDIKAYLNNSFKLVWRSIAK